MFTFPPAARVLCALGVLASAVLAPLRAAVPKDFAIDLKAAVSDTAPHIILSWSQRLQSNITTQEIHRRLKGSTSWTKLADLTATETTYPDSTAVPGVEYEYWMKRTLSGVTPNIPMGYLSAAVHLPLVHDRGKLLLVVDDTMATPLAPDIAQLVQDLTGDGWTVQTIAAPRAGTAASTKTLITNAYNTDPANVKMVYLLGKVPVPYSGNLAPDGHGDHVGAWPTDGYYGDVNGTWTDTTVNNTAASRAENDNLPGDGKFDQSSFPSPIELAVGRVHLAGMTQAPASGATETMLLRRYLRRAHEYRHRLGAYANVPRRTLLRDGWGHAFSSEPFAVTGWAGAFTAVGPTPTAAVDEAPSDQWFSASFAGGKTYLWGHGGGGGSYDAASSVGRSADFGRKPSRVVFTSLFGSYHGDWDANNNFMRAVLAGNATGDSLGLTCMWTGRPNWFVHPLGMGETIGYTARATMNTSQNGYTPGGFSSNGVHVGLMGDPALRLHMVEPPRGLGAQTAENKVTLKWNASTETNLLGYHVYRGPSPTGPFTRLTPAPISTTTYEDPSLTAGTAYSYLVRTLKLETAPGGTYENLSQASALTLTASASLTPGSFSPSELAASTQAGSPNVFLTWADNASDEIGYRIERRVGAGGAWTTLTSPAANATSALDPGPFTAGTIYYYRVLAQSPGGDSAPSNETSFEGIAGYLELTATKMKVNKSAGTAAITVNRFGGGTGAISVAYATANSSATAGTHYTATSGTLNWLAGEEGNKTITVPITNTATPQLPRQFKLTISAPTGSASLTTSTTIAVLIQDPTATLPPSWTQVILGTVTDSSPAVIAEGSLGSSLMGGSQWTAGDTSESGRFVYQSRTGDGMITAYFPNGTPAQTSNARFGVVVRADTAANAITAATMTSGNSTYGTRFNTRAAAAGALVQIPTTSTLIAPRWVRVRRAGNVFSSDISADGSIWTELGSTTLANMPATALWGIWHSSNNWNTTTFLGDYQLVTAQNLTIGNAPTAYQLWLQTNGLPTNGAGMNAPDASLMSDGVPNFMKYALGLTPTARRYGDRFTFGKTTVGTDEYLSLTYTRPEPAPAGMTYTAEASDAPSGWSTTGLVEVSNTVNGGLRTVTVRDGVPLATGGSKRFMHLRVSQP